MADLLERLKRLAENAPGRFCVDSTCIDCHLCESLAPGFFRHVEGKGYHVVSSQPLTEEEFVLCREAMEDCPVGAIGDDGGSA